VVRRGDTSGKGLNAMAPFIEPLPVLNRHADVARGLPV
jgi:hypothetical protein